MRRSRSRPLAVVIAFALLVMPVAAFVIVRPDSSPERGQAERRVQSRLAGRHRPHPRIDARPSPGSAGRSELVAARSSARDFVTAYLAYLGQRGPIRAIAHAAPTLLRAIAREPVRVTPAREQHPPLLRALSVVAQTGGTLRAVATLLTDIVDGDVGVIVGGDLGGERPNDQRGRGVRGWRSRAGGCVPLPRRAVIVAPAAGLSRSLRFPFPRFAR